MTREDDRRKEFEALRAEIGSADLSCQVIAAALAAITGAIAVQWKTPHAALVLQLVWLFGISYFAERRFAIRRIAAYVRHRIECVESGFGYERFLDEVAKRPRFLVAPLYREVGLGVAAAVVMPFVLDSQECPMSTLSILVGGAIAAYGLVICIDYYRYGKRLDAAGSGE